jgi:hypothetical protein
MYDSIKKDLSSSMWRLFGIAENIMRMDDRQLGLEQQLGDFSESCASGDAGCFWLLS